MVPHEINAESAIFVSESMAALQNMINEETVTLEGLQSGSLSDTRHPRHMRARRRPGPSFLRELVADSGMKTNMARGAKNNHVISEDILINIGAFVEST